MFRERVVPAMQVFDWSVNSLLQENNVTSLQENSQSVCTIVECVYYCIVNNIIDY